ncbi:MAG: cysteine synthase family protein [Proteobacteria bacterium]|nr:cysteine synthase family protein [Pseudomonadota bacterium]
MSVRENRGASSGIVAENVLSLIGNTPLVKICRITSHLPEGVEIYAKLEGYNPGGSVKDRPALRMIEEGEEDDRLTKDKIILDSTSGNTGIAYAMIGAVKGYKVRLVMPENVSDERKKMVAAFGAEVVYSDPLEGSDGAILLARELLDKDPEKYFKPDQYNNPANVRAHHYGTAREIIAQTDGKVTHFAATIGTGGTIMGNCRGLKEYNNNIVVKALEPESPFHGIEGLKHMDSSIVPGIYKEEELDGKVPIPTEESYDMAQRLAREEGLFVGQSSGAAMWGALRIAEEIDEGVVVTVFPDGGDKYLSTALWRDIV